MQKPESQDTRILIGHCVQFVPAVARTLGQRLVWILRMYTQAHLNQPDTLPQDTFRLDLSVCSENVQAAWTRHTDVRALLSKRSPNADQLAMQHLVFLPLLSLFSLSASKVPSESRFFSIPTATPQPQLGTERVGPVLCEPL